MKASSSRTGSKTAASLVDLWLRARVLAKAAKVNIATTPRRGKAHTGTMLDSFSGVAACCTKAASLASYLRIGGATVSQGLEGEGTGTGLDPGTTGAQGLPGVGAGVGAGVGGGTYGVVVTVVGM